MERRIDAHATDAQPFETTAALLGDRRRRHVVEILSGRESPIALDDLAGAVAAREAGTEPDEVPPEAADEVAVMLHHVHLPVLNDAELLGYDAATNTVTPARIEALAPLASGASASGDDGR